MAAEIVKPLQELHEKLINEPGSPDIYRQFYSTFDSVEKALLKKFENEPQEKKERIKERLNNLKRSWLRDREKLKASTENNREEIKEKSLKALAQFKHEVGIESVQDPKLHDIFEAKKWASDILARKEIKDYNGTDAFSQVEGALKYFLATVKTLTSKDSKLADNLYSQAVSAYQNSGIVFDKLYIDNLIDKFEWRTDLRELENKLNVKLSAQSYGVILGFLKAIDQNPNLTQDQKDKQKTEFLEKQVKPLKEQLEKYAVISWDKDYEIQDYDLGQEQADFLLEKLYNPRTSSEKSAATPAVSPDATKPADPNKPAESSETSPEQEKITSLQKTIAQIKMDKFPFKNKTLAAETVIVTKENYAELEQTAKEELSKVLKARKESIINKITQYNQTKNQAANINPLPFEQKTEWTNVLASLGKIEEDLRKIKTEGSLEELATSWKTLASIEKDLKNFEKDFNPFKEKINQHVRKTPQGTPAADTGSGTRSAETGSLDIPGSAGTSEREPGYAVPTSAPSESREKSDDPYAEYWQHGRTTNGFIFKGYPGELTINPDYVSPGEHLVLRNDQGKPVSILYGGEKVTLADKENAWEVKPLGHVEGLRFIKIKIERAGREFIAWTPENGLKKAEPEMVSSRESVESRESEQTRISEEIGEINTEYLEALTIIARDAERLGGADFTLRFNNKDLKFHISKLGPKNYVVSWADGKARLRFDSVDHFLKDLNSGNFHRTLTYIHLNNPKYYEKYKESIGPFRRELAPFSMQNMKTGEEIRMELDWKGAYAGDGNAEVRLRALRHGLIGFSIKRRHVGLDGKSDIRKGYAANFNDLVNQIAFARYEAENYDEDLKPAQLSVYNQQKKMLNDLRDPSRFYYPHYKDDQGKAFQTGRPLSFNVKDYRTIQTTLDWDQTGKMQGNATVTVRLGKDNMLYYKVDYPNKSFHSAEKRVGSFYELMANIDDAKSRAAQKRKEQPQKKVSQIRSWRERLRKYKRTASN